MHVAYNIKGHTHTVLECGGNSSVMVRWKDQGRRNGHVDLTEIVNGLVYWGLHRCLAIPAGPH